jgi:Na+/phosphate symporter
VTFDLPIALRLVLGLALFYAGFKLWGDGLKMLDPKWIKAIDEPYTLAGLVFATTLAVQSSSITIGAVVLLAVKGHISLSTAVAGVIAGNIGTSITPWLVAGAYGMPEVSRHVAVTHTALNLLMLALMPFHTQIAWVVRRWF